MVFMKNMLAERQGRRNTWLDMATGIGERFPTSGLQITFLVLLYVTELITVFAFEENNMMSGGERMADKQR